MAKALDYKTAYLRIVDEIAMPIYLRFRFSIPEDDIALWAHRWSCGQAGFRMINQVLMGAAIWRWLAEPDLIEWQKHLEFSAARH